MDRLMMVDGGDGDGCDGDGGRSVEEKVDFCQKPIKSTL